MAIKTLNSQLTLVELANRSGDGALLQIAEILAQTNDLLRFLPFLEANGLTGQKFAERTQLPGGAWRRVNDGISSESSKTRPRTESIGMLEAESKTDRFLVDNAPSPREYRLMEDMAFLEGLAQTMADTLIYGDTTQDPEKFHGLAPRLAALATNHVVSEGGSGDDLTSVFVMEVGPNAVHGIYPKGSKAGLQVEDLGLQRVEGETAGTTLMAYVTRFMWQMGLVVKDPARNIHRLCNIETAGSTNTLDDDNLVLLINELRGGANMPLILCNRTIQTQADILAKDQTNIAYTSSEFGGRPVTLFRGVPVVRMDAILNTESAIS